jgi:hypothetical protein
MDNRGDRTLKRGEFSAPRRHSPPPSYETTVGLDPTTLRRYGLPTLAAYARRRHESVEQAQGPWRSWCQAAVESAAEAEALEFAPGLDFHEHQGVISIRKEAA